ncbi:protein TIFY 11e-like [Panicum virgatum]|uniref:Protein TIFY n=1 Tax=Panicum virgatum TaxID=38727 RepID=A0A8T0MNL0_PANVG|nr:protein TIFY 11e-like [Panicum virgatum]KAG2538278.1 hypothetical protein PVAP13_9NG406700 [Panicum virgatum]
MVAAAEEAVTARGCTGGGPAATTSRFAAACGALSQYVRAAGAERARAGAWPAVPVPVRPLPLMPGADVEDPEAGPAPAAQMTIVYGGRALVLDDVPADRAADLLRLAAAAGRLSSAADLLPVPRKASLQRFMEKRKGRAAARAELPYRRPGERHDDLTLAL